MQPVLRGINVKVCYDTKSTPGNRVDNMEIKECKNPKINYQKI